MIQFPLQLNGECKCSFIADERFKADYEGKPLPTREDIETAWIKVARKMGLEPEEYSLQESINLTL
ncbi:MAG: hypothetical protein AB7F64_06945 [Gammaproteobacteria bacterium]